jgi:hypothetical protein
LQGSLWTYIAIGLGIGAVILAAALTAWTPIFALIIVGIAIIAAPLYFAARRMANAPAPPGGEDATAQADETEGGTVRQEQRGIA